MNNQQASNYIPCDVNDIRGSFEKLINFNFLRHRDIVIERNASGGFVYRGKNYHTMKELDDDLDLFFRNFGNRINQKP